MPATGKLYDPGAPTALEAALAQTVASGQSPFAGTLLAGYAAQRQQNVAAVNEAQAQSHLLDLANALRQQDIQTSGSVAGAALSSGRGIGPALGAVNKAAGLGMDPNAIAAAAADADRANTFNLAKTGAEIQNLGSEAGGGVADTSPILGSLGFGVTPATTPRGVRQSEISAGATRDAARIHADATRDAARIRGPSGSGSGGEGTVTLKGEDPQTRQAFEYKVPIAKAPQSTRNAINKAAGNTAVGIVHDATGSPMTPSGDAIQNDPALADQKAQFARDYPGYTLINQNGDPRDVVDPDGHVYRIFRVIDPNGMETTAKVEKRQ
jgi:hypothetical protein